MVTDSIGFATPHTMLVFQILREVATRKMLMHVNEFCLRDIKPSVDAKFRVSRSYLLNVVVVLNSIPSSRKFWYIHNTEDANKDGEGFRISELKHANVTFLKKMVDCKHAPVSTMKCHDLIAYLTLHLPRLSGAINESQGSPGCW